SSASAAPAVGAGQDDPSAPSQTVALDESPAAASEEAAGRPRRRRGLVIGAAAGAAVLVLGGGAFAAAQLIPHGASSPEEAAQRLVDGAVGGDVLALAGAFAPSEAQHLRPLVEEAARIRPSADEGAVDYLGLIGRLRE